MSSQQANISTPAVGRGRTAPLAGIWWRATALAVVSAEAVWVLLAPTAGVTLHVRQGAPGGLVNGWDVLVAAFLVASAAVAVASVVRRHSAHPRRTLGLIAAAVLVLSLAGPLGSAATASAALSLVALHLATATCVIPVLRRLEA